MNDDSDDGREQELTQKEYSQIGKEGASVVGQNGES